MIALIAKSAFIYLFLLFCMRISGKRQVGQLQISELITAFLISDIAASPIYDDRIPLIKAILPVVVLVSLEVLASYLTTKSSFFKRLLEPAPAVLISNGKLNIRELKRQRLTVDELVSSLRLNNNADVGGIRFCFLENNGQISSFTNDDVITLPVIVDGEVHENNLKLMGKTKRWLNERLREQNTKASEVFIALTDGITLSIYSKRENK